ncbi:alpha/beta hydrolase [Kitasatospora viridis]|uniref:Pimeloyl-ACP methyl ester carboxylesterase n=1 Tax=Kitasatospora viridis TaxID=281105 RepID=A0A561UIT6_9ACTN|nr:alpha/beta hydrolase [Kitasatospora viridis]TWF99254.1 pimeloyl-ACP methyl ester carboxylesterase [Kitasatospora viridis]
MDLSVRLTSAALNAGSVLSTKLAGKVSFYLFCRPLARSKVRGTEREVHERAVTETLTVNGKQVVAYRWGDGSRPVLLLHGWRSRASRYAPLVQRLQELGCTAVSFDAPAHGDSQGDTVTILEYRELIAQLQEKYGTFESVVAHSFGVLCSFLALREPLRAGRLVAIAGMSDFQFLRDEFADQTKLNARLRADLQRRIETELFPHQADPWVDFDAKQHTGQIDLPILVIHDEDDDTVPVAQAHRLKAAYGDQLELVVTKGLGHRKIMTDPAVLDSAIGFLVPESVGEVG